MLSALCGACTAEETIHRAHESICRAVDGATAEFGKRSVVLYNDQHDYMLIYGSLRIQDRRPNIAALNEIQPRYLIVNSTGGSSYVGITIGQTLRAMDQTNTVVHSLCASACASILLGADQGAFACDDATILFHDSREAVMQSKYFDFEALISEEGQRDYLRNAEAHRALQGDNRYFTQQACEFAYTKPGSMRLQNGQTYRPIDDEKSTWWAPTSFQLHALGYRLLNPEDYDPIESINSVTDINIVSPAAAQVMVGDTFFGGDLSECGTALDE